MMLMYILRLLNNLKSYENVPIFDDSTLPKLNNNYGQLYNDKNKPNNT